MFTTNNTINNTINKIKTTNNTYHSTEVCTMTEKQFKTLEATIKKVQETYGVTFDPAKRAFSFEEMGLFTMYHKADTSVSMPPAPKPISWAAATTASGNMDHGDLVLQNAMRETALTAEALERRVHWQIALTRKHEIAQIAQIALTRKHENAQIDAKRIQDAALEAAQMDTAMAASMEGVDTMAMDDALAKKLDAFENQGWPMLAPVQALLPIQKKRKEKKGRSVAVVTSPASLPVEASPASLPVEASPASLPVEAAPPAKLETEEEFDTRWLAKAKADDARWLAKAKAGAEEQTKMLNTINASPGFKTGPVLTLLEMEANMAECHYHMLQCQYKVAMEKAAAAGSQ
jgi:hypothetical protein